MLAGIRVIAGLWVITLLAACGGGSKDSGKEPPIVDTKPPFIIDNASQYEFAAFTLSFPEAMLQLGHYAGQALDLTEKPGAGNMQICSNGGSRTLTIQRSHTGTVLVRGDVIVDNLADCYVAELDEVLAGTIKLKLLAAEYLDGKYHNVQFEMDLSQVMFKGDIPIVVKDPVTVVVADDGNLRQITVKPATSSLRFDFADGSLYTLSQFELKSQLELTKALYQVVVSGKVALNHFSSNLSINTVTAIQGFIGEYPHAGEVNLTDSKNNKLALTANYVADSERVNVNFNNGQTTQYYWSELSEGVLWSWPGYYVSSQPERFRLDNFNLISISTTETVENFSPEGSVSLMFSRPVASFAQSEVLYFQNYDYGYEAVPAVYSINGALVTVSPERPLEPGKRYSLNFVKAASEYSGERWFYPYMQLIVSNAVVAKMTVPAPVFTLQNTPVLSATASVAQAGIASYHWQEISNLGVIFSDPSGVSTRFSLPQGVNATDIKVKLTVTDKVGRSHSTTQDIWFVEQDANVLLYQSDVGDYIGQGQTKLYQASSDYFYAGRIYSSNAVELRFERQLPDHYSISWNVSFAAPDNAPLEVGYYGNTMRFPFQQPARPGLSFSGEGRGCNSLAGSFEILEIEFDPQNTEQLLKLAADFTQYCENGATALRGKVRFNSEISLLQEEQ